MGQVSIPTLVTRRQYAELEKRADEHIKTKGWEDLLRLLQLTKSKGKARDAVVSLLQLEAVGGTDTDVFAEFQSLKGNNLRRIRSDAVEHVTTILKGQIEHNHTYFLDIDAMTMTPYVILVKEVIKARKRELEQLEKNPSRIEVLGTYYGFQILMTDGSKPYERSNQSYWRYYRRTWLDETITETAARAVKSLTGELAEEVDMDKTYRTLGGSRIFKGRCTKTTANILADAVRLALYKTPGHRASAARNLGRTEDSRVLPFLHHRLPLERNRKTRIAIGEAIGKVGHESSIELLKEQATPRGRYMSKEGLAMVASLGGIYSVQSKEALVELLGQGGNTLKAAAIQALSKQDPTDLFGLISPYLVDKSRPVVRASVMALSELGSKGESEIKVKAPVVIKRLGYDRPSRPALAKMLNISEIGGMESIHQYFATRINRLGREVRNWHNTANRTTYSYYWRRREERTRRRLEDFLRLADTHLSPPFCDELVKALETIVKNEGNSRSSVQQLGRRILSHDKESKQSKITSFFQTRLSSHS